MTAEAEGSTSTTPRTGSPTRRSACWSQLADERGLRERIEAMFARRAHQHHRGPRRAARRAAGAARRGRSTSTAKNVVPDVHAVLDRMAAFADAGPLRRVEGPHRQADPQRRQHRHRRLRPRPGDGLRGAARLQRPRRWPSASSPTSTAPTSPRRPRPRPRGDAVHRRLQDVHHAGDDDQRPHRPRLAARRRSATRPPSPSTSSPSRPTPRRCRSSASTPTTCSASGTGSAAATRWTRRSGCRR